MTSVGSFACPTTGVKRLAHIKKVAGALTSPRTRRKAVEPCVSCLCAGAATVNCRMYTDYYRAGGSVESRGGALPVIRLSVSRVSRMSAYGYPARTSCGGRWSGVPSRARPTTLDSTRRVLSLSSDRWENDSKKDLALTRPVSGEVKHAARRYDLASAGRCMTPSPAASRTGKRELAGALLVREEVVPTIYWGGDPE